MPSTSESVWAALSSSTARSSLGVLGMTCGHDKCRPCDSFGVIGVLGEVFMVSEKLPMYTGAWLCLKWRYLDSSAGEQGA